MLSPCVFLPPHRWYSIVERGGLPRSPCWRVWAAKRVRYKVRWRRKRKKGGETRNFWWEKGAGGRGADEKKRRPLNSPDFSPFPMTGSWDIGGKAENRIGGEKRRRYFVPRVPNFSAHSFFLIGNHLYTFFRFGNLCSDRCMSTKRSILARSWPPVPSGTGTRSLGNVFCGSVDTYKVLTAAGGRDTELRYIFRF